jgi:hypothetical protein
MRKSWMPAHEPLRQVKKAKSVSVKISKNDPNTARVNWQLADREFLTVEIPRYVLERFIVQAKRAIEEVAVSLAWAWSNQMSRHAIPCRDRGRRSRRRDLLGLSTMNKPQRFSSRIRGHRAGEIRRSVLPELRDDRRAAETRPAFQR